MTKRNVGTIIRAHLKGEKPAAIAKRVGVSAAEAATVVLLADRERAERERMRTMVKTAKEAESFERAKASAKNIRSGPSTAEELKRAESWRKT